MSSLETCELLLELAQQLAQRCQSFRVKMFGSHVFLQVHSRASVVMDSMEEEHALCVCGMRIAGSGADCALVRVALRSIHLG